LLQLKVLVEQDNTVVPTVDEQNTAARVETDVREVIEVV